MKDVFGEMFFIENIKGKITEPIVKVPDYELCVGIWDKWAPGNSGGAQGSSWILVVTKPLICLRKMIKPLWEKNPLCSVIHSINTLMF